MTPPLLAFITPMRDWAIEAPLLHTPTIELRDHELRATLLGPGYTYLCPEVAIPTERWHGLTRWQQDECRIRAATLSTSKAILVGRSAARVYGIPVIGSGHDVELNLPSRRSRRPRHEWPPKFHYRASVLRPIDLDTFNGLRVTNVYRTVIDVARLHGLVEGIVAFDALLALEKVTRAEVEKALALMKGVPGIRTARRAFELADPRSESPLESWGRAQILAADIPELESLQVQVDVLGGDHRVDLLLNGRTVCELHGDIKYDGSTGTPPVEQMKKDRRRERRIQNAGHPLIHADYADLATTVGNQSRFVGMVRESLAATALSDSSRRLVSGG